MLKLVVEDSKCVNRVLDCHFCKYAMCLGPKTSCDCYTSEYRFSHRVGDSMVEARACERYTFCDVFPKLWCGYYEMLKEENAKPN